MKEFFTRELHGKSQKFELHTPDGKKTKKHLMVVGSDSDYFRNARAELARDENTKNLDTEEMRAALVACLVSDGNLGGEYSNKKAVELLLNAPYIRDAVDAFAADHSNFLAKK